MPLLPIGRRFVTSPQASARAPPNRIEYGSSARPSLPPLALHSCQCSMWIVLATSYTLSRTHTHTAGPHPLKTRALLPVLAWPRFEWFVQFQSKAWLVPCKTNDRFQRCGAKCANQPIRSNRVRLGQVGSGTCFLSRSPWAYNHQLNVSTSIWTPWLDLGPKRQVDIPIYPKHITSYLLLWATYISHIAFNPFRAIFAYRQRQAIFILTYTHA